MVIARVDVDPALHHEVAAELDEQRVVVAGVVERGERDRGRGTGTERADRPRRLRRRVDAQDPSEEVRGPLRKPDLDLPCPVVRVDIAAGWVCRSTCIGDGVVAGRKTRDDGPVLVLHPVEARGDAGAATNRCRTWAGLRAVDDVQRCGDRRGVRGVLQGLPVLKQVPAIDDDTGHRDERNDREGEQWEDLAVLAVEPYRPEQGFQFLHVIPCLATPLDARRVDQQSARGYPPHGKPGARTQARRRSRRRRRRSPRARGGTA